MSKDVYVLAEQRDGNIQKVAFELVGEATKLAKDLKDVEDSNLGLAGSPTKIAKASDKVRKGAGEKVTLDPEEAVDYIMDKLAEKHVI